MAARHSCSYLIYVCGLQPQTMAATRVCLRHMQSDEFGWLPPLFILCIRVRIATPDNRGNRCVPSAHAKRRIWLAATPVHALYTCAGCHPRQPRQLVCAFGTCKAANLAARPPLMLYIRVRVATPDDGGNRCVPSAHAKRRILAARPSLCFIYVCGLQPPPTHRR